MKAQKPPKKVVRGKEERLPSRFARSELTGGDMVQRSMNNYAKKAPKAEDQLSFPFMSKMF